MCSHQYDYRRESLFSLLLLAVTLERCFYSVLSCLLFFFFFFLLSMGAFVCVCVYHLNIYSTNTRWKHINPCLWYICPHFLCFIHWYFSFRFFCYLLFSFLSFHLVAYNFYLLHCHFFSSVAAAAAMYLSFILLDVILDFLFIVTPFFRLTFFYSVDYFVEINEREPNKWIKTLLTVTR